MRIYNASGNEICVLKGHTDLVRHAVFSPNDKYVLTSSFDKSVRLWFLDLADSKEVVKLGGHEDKVNCGRFSSDGLKVVTADMNGIARIFAVDTVSGVLTESEINPLHVLPKTGGLNWAEFQPNNSDMLVTAG